MEESRALCRRLLDEVFLPSLVSNSKDFEEMSRVVLESVWPVSPYIDPNAFIKFTLILASKAATNNNHSLKIGKSFTIDLDIFSHRFI